jgi:pantetheine-phosphate adenylyltransferase
MRTAIYPGSFDPITIGHLEIIERAALLFDSLIVTVMYNMQKVNLFSFDERVALIEKSTCHLPNVTVKASQDLLAAYCETVDARIIVKGLRAVSDFEHEFQMALVNRHLNNALETVFLASEENHHYLSSSIVREVGMLGGDIRSFVPAIVATDIEDRLRDTAARLNREATHGT